MGVGKNRIARIGFVGLGIAIFVGSCSGKERNFTNATTEEIPLSDTGGPIDSIPDPGAAPRGEQGGGTSESQPAYDLADASVQASVSGGSGICDDQGNCRCDADAESCAPISLCADGGAACESTCPGCLIGAECVGADTVNPSSSCQICDPIRNARAWSNNDDATCEDGLFCTTEDTCVDARCQGTPLECENGVACDGISTCDEELDQCSPDENQCGNGAVCNVATGTCVTTCTGCLIAGVCLANGAEEPGNPCQICDPARSTSAYSAAVGKSCGAGPNACSQQDTCDAQGACRPNHLPVDAPCGDSSSSACDRPNSCDGNGACQSRQVSNNTPCDDGQFCTVGDRCQGGSCAPTGNRNCGANQSCNEGANECQCQGCVVANTCFASGALNASNSCQICDPSRSTTAFSPNNAGTCNDGLFCTSNDRCQAGRCVGVDPCGLNQACNEGSDRCDCAGCNVNNTCHASGAIEPGNPCGICDPSRNRTGFSPNVGASCGRGQEACSAQDTCNDQRACVPNHFQSGTGCGSISSSACDQPDSCDGNGVCQNRNVTGTCNDGRFCSTGDRCQQGSCVPTVTQRVDCGTNQVCNTTTDRCECQGCLTGNTCVAVNGRDPNNSCQRCDSDRVFRNQCFCTTGELECRSPAGGDPNCSSWDFESSTQGWEIDVASAGGQRADVGQLTSAIPPRQAEFPTGSTAPSGSRALALRFEGRGDPGRNTIFIRVPLCAANLRENLAGKKLQAFVRLVSDPANPLTPGVPTIMGGQGHFVSLYTAQSPFAGAILDFHVDPFTGLGEGEIFPPVTGPLKWLQVDVDFTERARVFSPPSDLNANYVGFRFIVARGWNGTIYVDNVSIY